MSSTTSSSLPASATAADEATEQPVVLTLYHFAGASSLAAIVVLNWTGLEYTAIKPTDSSLTGAFADQINPAGAVPALVVPTTNTTTTTTTSTDGSRTTTTAVLTQNPAVLSYIAKRANRIDLLGGDNLVDQCEVLKWSSFLSADVHSSFWVVFFTNRYTTSTDEAVIAQTKEAGLAVVQKKVQIMEDHMKDGNRVYFVTDHKTYADAHAYVVIGWVRKYFPALMEHYPNLDAFLRRMDHDEGVQQALPYNDDAIYGL